MSHGEPPTLELNDLRTHFFTKAGVVKAVDGVSLSVNSGEVLGLVGESGSGKSVTGFSILGLVDPPGRVTGGHIRFQGRELVGLDDEQMRSLRGAHIAMIFQDPMMTLNPVLRIDTQMIEAIQAHEPVTRRQAYKRAREALVKVGIAAPDERLAGYPHQFSGGMRQRVAIATAMLNEPALLIADEPTTALDVTIQAQILFEVQKLCRDSGTALIWITHDLTVVAGLADRICVMYAGRDVEQGSVDEVLDTPLHPYTYGLIGSVPSRNKHGQALHQIPGMTPSLLNLPPGCAFRERCDRSSDSCHAEPPVAEVQPGPTTFALRTGRYKFIQYHGIWDLDELYDLKNDPLEEHNLIFSQSHQAADQEDARRPAQYPGRLRRQPSAVQSQTTDGRESPASQRFETGNFPAATVTREERERIACRGTSNRQHRRSDVQPVMSRDRDERVELCVSRCCSSSLPGITSVVTINPLSTSTPASGV